MRNEITAAVVFLVQLIEKNEKFSPDQLDCFRQRLIELLTERFKNHWFPDKPFKGQGYRCIRVNSHSRRDETLENAANAAGFKYEDLSLPVELTLWVDPQEVCCRFGESKGSYCTLASFQTNNNSSSNNTASIFHDEKENKLFEGSTKAQKNPSVLNMDQETKPKSSSSSNQNYQTNTSAGRRRILNSPRSHVSRNRFWSNHSFNMNYGPHPINHQPWYNVIPPHFIGGQSPPPPPPPSAFVNHRTNKWNYPSSYPTGITRFHHHHWSQKSILKV